MSTTRLRVFGSMFSMIDAIRIEDMAGILINKRLTVTQGPYMMFASKHSRAYGIKVRDAETLEEWKISAWTVLSGNYENFGKYIGLSREEFISMRHDLRKLMR